MSTPAVASRQAGFTMLEALLAVLLMGVILTALASVTAQWLPSWDRGIARLQREEAVATALDQLVADISQAENISLSDTNVQPIFDGGALSLFFVRRILNPNLVSGLEVVRLGDSGDERTLALTRSTAPLRFNGGDSDESAGYVFANPVIMLRAPLQVTFSYAGPDRVWQDTWRAAVVLPRAVRLTVRRAATSEVLAVSTSTLIRSELPARCMWAQKLSDCPGLPAEALGVGGASGGAGSGGGTPGNH